MTPTILITGANGDVADAIGRSLKDGFPDAVVAGCDLGEQWPAGRIFRPMLTVPSAGDDDYVDGLATAARTVQADLIIPTTEPEIDRLSRELDSAAHLPLLMNTPDIVRAFLDKLETYRWLIDSGVSTPKTFALSDATTDDLPLIVKPRFGRGSKHVVEVHTREHLSHYLAQGYPDFIAQTLIDHHDGEFTCALFKHGPHVRYLTMRRWLSGGLTSKIVVERDPMIDKTLEMIANRLPTTAAVNVQLRVQDGNPLVFEVNPRLSGTTRMRHDIGFKDACWWVAAQLHDAEPEAFAPLIGTRVYRTYGELVVAGGQESERP